MTLDFAFRFHCRARAAIEARASACGCAAAPEETFAPRPRRQGPLPLCHVVRGMALAGVLLVLAAPVHAKAGYRAVRGGPGSVARLREELGEERFLDLLRVNRRDARHAMLADTLLVPDAGSSSLDLSPFPGALPETDSIPKLILVSIRVQAFGAYENGRLVRWGPICSGGKASPSRRGLYHVNWKARVHTSSVNDSWIMPYTVNIDDVVGTALHQYDLPGLPASHCCIRLLEPDAAWVFGWVVAAVLSKDGMTRLVEGTPVVLFGAYDFGAPPPWRGLAADREADRLTPEEIESALKP